jgi:two-component system sensor histidine kinase RpfC
MTPKLPLGQVFARLRKRRDLEHEMSINRLAGGLLILTVICWLGPARVPHFEECLITSCVYLGLGILLFVHLLVRPATSRPRKVSALLLDLGTLSYGLHIQGGVMAWLYPAYLWITFGNGFRFGGRYLLAATGLSASGFGFAVATNPFWLDHAYLSAGLACGLVVLPLYALTLINKLSQARRAAEEANRAKSLFLASVSHELRTPLNAIIGTGVLLERSALQPEQREMSQTITTSARTLLSLIDGILDLARIEAAKMPTLNNDFDLYKLLHEILRIVQVQAQAKSLLVGLHVSTRTPRRVRGDMRRLQEILLNLVSNGVKFTEQGSVTIYVDAVEQDEAGCRLRFEVSDTGIGIAPEARERIFETFTQADETIMNRFGGTGLGLAISRESVRLLGGDMAVTSEVGAGSTFRFELAFPHAEPVLGDPGRFDRARLFLLFEVPDLVAPVLERLSRWGISVERIDAATAARAGLPAPEAAGARSVLAFDRRHISDGEERSFPEALAAGALSFVEVRDAAQSGSPSQQLRRAYATILAPPFSDGQIAYALDIVAVVGPSTPEAGAGAGAGAASPVRRCRILVADDNRINQRVASMILEQAGHDVVLADDGEQALDLLSDETFDIAIMDVNMPVMNGIEAVKLYRFISLGRPRMPIIALTADVTAETSRRCIDAGMDVCTVKPIEPARLVELVQELVPDARPAASRAAATPPVPAGSASEGGAGDVMDIASHPRFRKPTVPAIDAQALDKLHRLGGAEFVGSVVDEFLADAAVIIARLRESGDSVDVAGFRFHAHALRSGAANIGAGGLTDLCQPWQSISAEELRLQARAHVERLDAEFGRVASALRHHRFDAGAARQ